MKPFLIVYGSILILLGAFGLWLYRLQAGQPVLLAVLIFFMFFGFVVIAIGFCFGDDY